jgi:hypothetical protein
VQQLCVINQFRPQPRLGFVCHIQIQDPRDRYERPGGMTQGEHNSMSAQQGSSGCRISVDPPTADVLRVWDPATITRTESIEVPLSTGHIEQLHKRRCDLLDTNLDLLGEISTDNRPYVTVMAEIHANRHATEALNRVFDAYSDTITR